MAFCDAARFPRKGDIWSAAPSENVGASAGRRSAAPEVPARLSSCLALRVKPIDRPGDPCRVGDDLTRPSKPLAVLCRDAKEVFRGSRRSAVPFAIVRATSELEPLLTVLTQPKDTPLVLSGEPE